MTERPRELRLTVSFEPLRDPWVRAALVLTGIAVTGLVLLALGWRGSARTLYVPLQMPWLVSAGLAGIALTGGALALLDVHLERRRAAIRRQQTDDLVREAILLVEAWRDRPSSS